MNNDEVKKAISHLIGTPYVPSVKAYISELTGRTRVVGVNEVSTKEMDPNRIHLIGDDNNCIASFQFG
ncbi:hypothetical protein AQS70_10150 [Pseudomonas endophytica]|uniref:Peptidase inhibitor I78 family protein n=1 Tax=Pseudomonas endophytica TaxID=1563157 RepID=A0A0Q0T1D6_9PSED|nr:hypothetical protein [Pseudomonas endophytica]KQB53478.1 hypothetical protein AQS70_10150 [Pseudomonas endophytica]